MQIEILDISATDKIIVSNNRYISCLYCCTITYQIGDGKLYTSFIQLGDESIENLRNTVLSHLRREIASNVFKQRFNEKIKAIKGVYKDE